MKPSIATKIDFKFEDIPDNTCFKAGYLVSTNGSWRSKCPSIDNEKCNGCQMCYLHCPDGAIKVEDKKSYLDLDFCKGCGICAKICKTHAITMVDEK